MQFSNAEADTKTCDAAAEPAGRRARRNVGLLALALALGGANSSVIFATGAIIGSELAPNPGLATLPISIFVVGMAAGTLPAGSIARHYGRRTAFLTGTSCGFLCGVLAAVAIIIGSFTLFCVATFFGGLYGAVAQSYRFAAADGARAIFRAKAIALVMAGGIFAGVLGPQLVNWTMSLWTPYLFAASFAAQAVVALIASAAVAFIELPKPTAAETEGARPLVDIARQPRFLAAALCGVVSYSMMNLVMTSAPLAMKLCGFQPADSNFVIQWHIVAMYLPSFFTGNLIVRLGAQRVVALGMTILIGSAITGLTGVSLSHFSLALVLLGLGWNFGFVGASTMVVGTHNASECTKVQAFNDFLVFGVMTLSSFSSGQILALYGWAMVNWVVFVPVGVALVALLLGTRPVLERHLGVVENRP
jgi:MFS family permease